MKKYKGLQVPRLKKLKIKIGLPGAIDRCPINTPNESINVKGFFCAIDVCSEIDCVDCVADVDENGSATYIEFLIEEGYITKAEALEYTLAGGE